jgi:hypothetical protein
MHNTHPPRLLFESPERVSFCVVGQPMAILLYTVDYQYGKYHTAGLDLIEEEQCRVMLGSRCLVP